MEKQSSGIDGEGYGLLDVDTDTYKRRNRKHARKGILRLMFARVVFMLGGDVSL